MPGLKALVTNSACKFRFKKRPTMLANLLFGSINADIFLKDTHDYKGRLINENPIFPQTMRLQR